MNKALFVGCLVVILAGCGAKPRSTSTDANSPSPGTNLSQQTTPTSAQNQVELLSTGAEPKQQLRFTPPANAKQTVQMTMNMDMAMSVAGQPQQALDSPPIQVTMEAQVTNVDANGDVYANFSYTKADVIASANTPPQLVDALRSQIQNIIGLSGSLVIDNQGNTKQVDLNLPEELNPNTKQMVGQISASLKQLSSPVPAQPVGVGAKWQVPRSVTANGMTLDQTATYELVDLKDNVATMQVGIKQQAQPQKVNPPGLPPGASIDLKSLNSQGNGKVTRALNQMIPSSSTMSVRSDMEMTVKDANNQQETTMGMNSTIDFSLEAK